MSVESRQRRRARERAQAKRETRRQQFDRVHGEVLAGRTIRDLWLVYARDRFERNGLDLNDPAVRGTVEQSFYAGVAAMFELMQRVSPDGVSEDVGVEMLARLHEELETYTRGLK
jgi:hypothetical protein